jgi:hypothetical protein
VNRRERRQAAKRQAPEPVSLLDALLDQRITGGCEDCDAYQDVTRVDGVYHVTIAHDVTCPWLNAREGTR